MIWLLPLSVFVLLAALERLPQPNPAESYQSYADHLLNIAGLAIQGTVIPLMGYLIATHVLADRWPGYAGILEIGWLGAFLLNFVAVDFLYYWQHRLFHHVPALWALHECHHAAPVVNVWATSRNALALNFLFVYLLVNPVLGFLCDRPDGFFAAAAVTASLDLWRHSRLPERFTPRWLGSVLVTPLHHHAHHAADGQPINFGANLIFWDKLFGTARQSRAYPRSYGTARNSWWRQFLFPW